AVLWDDPSLINEARALAADVPALAGMDKALDVIGGSAGAIAPLEGLKRVGSSDGPLNAAVPFRQPPFLGHARQTPQMGWKTDVASTEPLTGFSHGAAGIAWALLKLAAWSGEARFREAAESAIAYERSTFVGEEGNWPDYRLRPTQDQSYPRCEVAWCHG